MAKYQQVRLCSFDLTQVIQRCHMELAFVMILYDDHARFIRQYSFLTYIQCCLSGRNSGVIYSHFLSFSSLLLPWFSLPAVCVVSSPSTFVGISSFNYPCSSLKYVCCKITFFWKIGRLSPEWIVSDLFILFLELFKCCSLILFNQFFCYLGRCTTLCFLSAFYGVKRSVI